jgi:hypothetical protein
MESRQDYGEIKIAIASNDLQGNLSLLHDMHKEKFAKCFNAAKELAKTSIAKAVNDELANRIEDIHRCILVGEFNSWDINAWAHYRIAKTKFAPWETMRVRGNDGKYRIYLGMSFDRDYLWDEWIEDFRRLSGEWAVTVMENFKTHEKKLIEKKNERDTKLIATIKTISDRIQATVKDPKTKIGAANGTEIEICPITAAERRDSLFMHALDFVWANQLSEWGNMRLEHRAAEGCTESKCSANCTHAIIVKLHPSDYDAAYYEDEEKEMCGEIDIRDYEY